VTRTRLLLEVRRSVRPLIVFAGLVLVAGFAGTETLGHMHAGSPFADWYRVRVAVDDAKGVVAGQQEVRIAGVPVGKIASVTVGQGHPVLTLAIQRKYAPLYRDARLRLRPATPLDDLYLNVESRGHPQAGVVGMGQPLAAERTQVPVDISRVLNIFDAPTRARFQAMVDEFGRAMHDNGRQLRETLVALTPFLRTAARLTRETADRRTQTRRLVHNFRLVMDELGHRDRALNQLVLAGDSALGELARSGAPLGKVLDELAPTLTQLRTTTTDVDGAFDELDPALTALQPTAAALEPGLRGLRSFANTGAPAFSSLRGVIARLSPLTSQAKPLTQELAQAFAQLRPSAPRLDRITAAVVPCELAVQKFFTWTASVFKFRDARTFYPRAEAVPGSGPYIDGESCAPKGGGG
jgi:phospholipid/cholesterol/gamma-HCH transport system substrate-binding protein